MYDVLTNHFFQRQNIWLKTLILLMGSFAAVVLSLKALALLFVLTLAYCLLSVHLYAAVLNGLRTILPFVTAYSLIAVLTGIQFPMLITFILRIVSLVLLVVYFSTSLSIRRVLEYTAVIHKHRFFYLPLFYAISTLLYLKRFSAHYRNARHKAERLTLSSPITMMIEALTQNWEHRNSIEKETENLLIETYKAPNFVCKSNVYGCFYITALTLILSV